MESSPTTQPRRTVSGSESDSEKAVRLFTMILNNQTSELQKFLDANPDLYLPRFRDVNGNTILNMTALNGQLYNSRLFLYHTSKQARTKEEITAWVNTKSKEGFTPLHCASFKGNLELCELLVDNGADPAIKSEKGLTVMHLAAQGDHPAVLAYFISKGVDPNVVDDKGNSPLHWAALSGAECVTPFLLVWGCSPNLAETQNDCTPLHLAVEAGSYKVVRTLLIKGADRRAVNKEGKKPIDLAIEHEYNSIAELLKGRNWFMDCMNIKPDLQKKRTRTTMIWFLCLYFGMFASNILFVFPYVKASDVFWIISFAVIVPLSFFFFLLAMIVNPGKMKNKDRSTLRELLMFNDPKKICAECAILRPSRSKHCEMCNSCIAVHDHHCPWINNCVGAKNHKYFLLYIISMELVLIYLAVFNFVHWEIDDKEHPTFNFVQLPINILVIGRDIVSVIQFIVSGGLCIPLLLLIYVQLGNFAQGKTTTERFAGNANANQQPLLNASVNESIISLQDTAPSEKMEEKGCLCWKNYKDMCCGNASNPNYFYRKQTSKSVIKDQSLIL